MKPLSLGLLASLSATVPVMLWLFALDATETLSWKTHLRSAVTALWITLGVAAALMGPWTAILYRGTAQLREISLLVWIPMPLLAFAWQGMALQAQTWALGLAAVFMLAFTGLLIGRAIDRFGKTNAVKQSMCAIVQVGLALGVGLKSDVWLTWL